MSREEETCVDSWEDVLGAIAERQALGVGGEQWVSAGDLRLPPEMKRGLGSRLAALERRGLIECQCMNQSWDLRRKYDVTWRLTDAGRGRLGP